MTKESGRATRSRVTLTRERVLHAAIVMADRHGIGALSMRRLATELQVEAMSLYNHVANKSDLLDGMIDMVFAEIGLPPEGIHWKDAMRQRAVAVQQVLTRHPWAIGLMDSRTKPGPATLRHHDTVIGVFRNAGFSIEMAAHAVSLLDSYIFGFLLQQQSMPFQTPDHVPDVAGTILHQMPAGAYPHLAEMITRIALQPGYDYMDEFAYGLDLVLDSLDRAQDRS